MPRKNFTILIAERDDAFRARIRSLCVDLGKVWEAPDAAVALDLLMTRPFRLILLDWEMIRTDLRAFEKPIRSLQSDAVRLALFLKPQLPQVLAAMKWGMKDAFWESQPGSDLKKGILDSIGSGKKGETAPNTVTHLAESLVERAIGQKTSLFKARRDFSRAFLSQVMNRQGGGRGHLASVMKVSSRTLQRYLAN